MNTQTLTLEPTDHILPLLERTKSTSMKRVGVAVDVRYVAGQIRDWGPGCKSSTTSEAVWYYLRNVMTSGAPSDASLAVEDFIYDRVPGGKDTNIREMSVADRRELFGGIAREASQQEARYRTEYREARA